MITGVILFCYICYFFFSLSIYTWRECVFCCYWMEYSFRVIWTNAQFKSNVSLLIICLNDLSIVKSGTQKSLTVIVFLFVSLFRSVSIWLMYLGALMLGAYIFTIIIILFINWPLYDCIMTWWFLATDFEVNFVWHKFSYPYSLLIPIQVEYFFPSLHFESICILICSESLICSI